MQETYTCDHCGAVHPLDEMFHVGEDVLCPDCAGDLTILCDECGTRIYIDDDEGDDTRVLCHDCCVRHYTRCEHCGTLISNDSVYQYGGEDLCRDCYDDRCESGPIHEYSYMPELVFHGKGLRRFGVELEIDEGGESTVHARRFLDIANRHVENLYIKTDGSLDDGLELVTHPMTLEYHLNDMPWKDILDEAKRLGYRSTAQAPVGCTSIFRAWRSAVLMRHRNPASPAWCTSSKVLAGITAV